MNMACPDAREHTLHVYELHVYTTCVLYGSLLVH